MLVNLTNIESSEKPQVKHDPVVFSFKDKPVCFHGDSSLFLNRTITALVPGQNIHAYSWANFNLVRLIMHLLRFTGPAHLFMTSYSFSQKSIEALLSRKQSGILLSVRILTDNRVRSMSPKPFQMLKSSFDTRTISVHAKVALIYNDDWKITVVTSQNATDNPKLERLIIFTDPEIFDFDFKILEHEFNSAAIN